jgi:phosphoglycerate kinase
MRAELLALDKALGNPERPVTGIVGGSKVSSKLDLLRHLVTKLDKLAIGGGMANTFLYAQGHDVGASYCEKELAETARDIIRLAGQNSCKLFLPLDIVVAERLAPGAAARVRGLGEVDEDERILDAGPETVERLCRAIANSKTLIWNGPLGVFEMPPFDRGTMQAARFAAERAKAGLLVAVAGGGDTVAALNAAGVTEDFTFVSTAGGAFLEWMEGRALPGVAALQSD